MHGITQRRTNHRIGNAGVAAGGVNNGLAALQGTTGQTCLDHAQRRPVLHGAAGVEPLGLGTEFDIWEFPANAFQPKQGRVTNTVQQGFTRPVRLSPLPNV